jgi:fatty-acyl-CoA synthase
MALVDAVISWARTELAAYKVPRRVVFVVSINRSPSGKVDYKRLQDLAVEVLATAG